MHTLRDYFNGLVKSHLLRKEKDSLPEFDSLTKVVLLDSGKKKVVSFDKNAVEFTTVSAGETTVVSERLCKKHRDAEIILMSYGLSGGDKATMDEVGGLDHIQLTREMVRQTKIGFEDFIRNQKEVPSCLIKAVKIIKDLVPCKESLIIKELTKAGLANNDVSFYGIKSIVELLSTANITNKNDLEKISLDTFDSVFLNEGIFKENLAINLAKGDCVYTFDKFVFSADSHVLSIRLNKETYGNKDKLMSYEAADATWVKNRVKPSVNGKENGAFILERPSVSIHNVVESLISLATKLNSHNGAVSVYEIAKLVKSKKPESSVQFAREVINASESADWINDEWFFFSGKTRNRLSSRIKKIFSVYESVDIDVFISAIERSWNKNKKDSRYQIAYYLLDKEKVSYLSEKIDSYKELSVSEVKKKAEKDKKNGLVAEGELMKEVADLSGEATVGSGDKKNKKQSDAYLEKRYSVFKEIYTEYLGLKKGATVFSFDTVTLPVFVYKAILDSFEQTKIEGSTVFCLNPIPAPELISVETQEEEGGSTKKSDKTQYRSKTNPLIYDMEERFFEVFATSATVFKGLNKLPCIKEIDLENMVIQALPEKDRSGAKWRFSMNLNFSPLFIKTASRGVYTLLGKIR